MKTFDCFRSSFKMELIAFSLSSSLRNQSPSSLCIKKFVLQFKVEVHPLVVYFIHKYWFFFVALEYTVILYCWWKLYFEFKYEFCGFSIETYIIHITIQFQTFCYMFLLMNKNMNEFGYCVHFIMDGMYDNIIL